MNQKAAANLKASEIVTFQNSLPKTWEVGTFSDLVAFLTDYQANGSFASLKENVKTYHSPNHAILVRLKDLRHRLERSEEFIYTDEKGFKFLEKSSLRGGEILVANVGSVGTTLLMPTPRQPATLAPNMFLVYLSPLIDKRYFLHYCTSQFYWRQISFLASGSGQPKINKKQYRSVEIPVAPIAEQQRIVDKIEELFSDLDSGINSLKTARQQLKVYRQAVLKWAFEGKLTAQWREEQQRQGQLESADTLLAQIKAEREQHYQKELEAWQSEVEAWEAIGKEGKKPRKPSKLKEFRDLTDTDLAALPDLPEHWFYIRAEGISDFITKGTTPKKEELFEVEGDIPFIKVYNLTHRGTLDFSINPTFVSHETHRGFLGRSKVLPGDVLINIVGPPLGKVSLIPDTFKEWNINQAVARYRLLDAVSNKYFTYYLLSQSTVNMMSARAKATAGQFNLTLQICRDVEVPICSKAEQEKIVEEIESRLSICDQLEADIEANLKKAEALRQSILKQAFAGKLVPQDPKDEPAEVLLERIRAEREKAKPAQKASSSKAKAKGGAS